MIATLLLASFVAPLQVQAPGASRNATRDVTRITTMVRAADADGDARVTPEEWSVWVASLPFGPAPDAEGDLRVVTARILVPRFDLDDDRAFTPADLRLAFQRLDLNGSGALEPGERPAGQTPARGGPGIDELLLGGLVFPFADQNHDDYLAASEWTTFLASLEDAAQPEVPEASLLEWLQTARTSGGEADRNAVSAGVFVLTYESALDADRNGRFDRADLELHRQALDVDADGFLTVEELRQAAAARQRAQAEMQVSEADRERPPLMPWQRNLEDALALVRATKKPLLVCVNMDGESASDALAFGRYRDPEFVELAQGFVPVIVSPDRRNPVDRDDRGRRIADPRFGRIVTGEAIDIEPDVYERYFAGRRVAPRHVGVSPEGEILFDVFLVSDLTVIDDALRRFGNRNGIELPEPRTEAELLESPDAAHRDRLEELFASGDERTRVRLAGQALSAVRRTQHPELLRMALRDDSESVRRQALWTTAQNAAQVPMDLYARALNLARGLRAETAALTGSLAVVAADESDAGRSKRAAGLLGVFETFDDPAGLLDEARWRTALRLAPSRSAAPTSVGDFDEFVALLEDLDADRRSDPHDAELLLQIAAANMRLAQVQIARGQNPLYFLSDAETAAEEARQLSHDDPRALAYLAWSSYLQADLDKAGEYAARALPGLLPYAASELAGHVLDVLAQSRVRGIYAATSEGREWPAAWVPDARAAFEALVLHPIAQERHVTAQLDFLAGLQAYDAQATAIRVALAGAPTSSTLHAYLRGQVLRDEGAAELVRVYEEELLPAARTEDRAAVLWYAGLAHLMAAEHERQAKDDPAALAAYRAADREFRRSFEERGEFADSANHYRCLALAGASQVLAGQKRFDEAVASLVEGISARPASSALPDGLGRTPLQVARELEVELRGQARTELADAVDRCLEENGLTPTDS